jgi:hypothetical protein
VLIRVQHRAGRDAPLERLLANLPPAVEVITDDEVPLNPWRGYRKCLEQLPESGHVVVLQDDSIVCRNFLPALKLIAKANPSTIVTLFVSAVPRRTLHRMRGANGQYVEVHPQDLVHVVGVLWPVERAGAFLEWVDENQRRLRGREFISDDATLTRWFRFSRERILATVPSLVQHPDDVPSVVNERRVSGGRDAGRMAALWIEERNPLELDWSL